ncbi:hypothetical protein JT358_12875 [Micrococcales bacterium 31B]|nr:hypothetical protein [Micrococcales bacterium 31B]
MSAGIGVGVALWARVRWALALLPVMVVCLVLDFVLAGQSAVVTRVLGAGANTVDVNQAAVAPLATCVYVMLSARHVRRERSSWGRAQRVDVVVWLVAGVVAGLVPWLVGVMVGMSSLRVAGVTFLGLVGLASVVGYLTQPMVGSAMPLGYAFASLMLANQQGGPSDYLWPLALDVSWSWAWSALLAWLLGTLTIAARPPYRHITTAS